MPKYQIDYTKTHIYTVVCPSDKQTMYIGITSNIYSIRHRIKRQISNGETYRPLIQWIINNNSKYAITVIESYECDNKQQAINRALYHVNKLHDYNVNTSLLTTSRVYKTHINKTCIHNNTVRTCPICNPKNHISNLVRTNVNKALKYDNIRCPPTSLHILGCSIADYTKHIESQFTLPCNDGMNWNNRHLWDIDHIIGLNSRINGVQPSITDILNRLHYTNTQPLWKCDNIRKSNSINMLDLYRNDRQIIEFKLFWDMVDAELTHV